jgi:hypothetical protein
MSSSADPHAARLTIDYPDRDLDRFGGVVLVLPVLLLIVFRNKYPRWWFDFNLQLARFSTRVLSYLALMSDRYPSTDDEQSVHLDLDYPNVPEDLNRWLPLVKWLLAVPHYGALLSPTTMHPIVPNRYGTSECCTRREHSAHRELDRQLAGRPRRPGLPAVVQAILAPHPVADLWLVAYLVTQGVPTRRPLRLAPVAVTA